MFQSEKFRCWLEVETDDRQPLRIDVHRIAARFPINQIPNCSVSVCVGLETSNQEEASIHRLRNEILNSRPARVFVEGEIFFSEGLKEGVLQKERRLVSEKIFEGYVSGVSVRKVLGTLEFNIEIQHWLYKLDHVSILSQFHMPSNPIDFIFSAALGPGPGQLVPQTGPFFQTTGFPIVQTLAVPERIREDFWGKVIYAIMAKFSNPEWTAGAAGVGFAALSNLMPGLDPGASVEERREIAALLQKFEPSFDLPAYEPKNEYHLGIPIKLRENIDKYLASSISNYLNKVLNRPIANSTFWSKILEICSSFDLMIVPLVDKALVVPITLGLREPRKKIAADQYFSVSTSVGIPKPIRGVILYGGRATETGYNLVDANDKNNVLGSLMYGGSFERRKKKGAFLILEAPAWADSTVLSPVLLPEPKAANVANLNKNKNILLRAALAESMRQATQRLRKVLDDYAAALYYRENLKARGGVIGGPFRTDICPGTLVEVESFRVEFLKDNDKAFHASFVAMVGHVDLFIDATNNTAGSSFHLLGLRSLEENESDDYTASKHPLWDKTWTGAPLVTPKDQ
ncbi:MAG: hypothetical protein QW299_07270 [Candidatus Caldarchaeum sp.]|jgi:hypothetical protein